MHGGEIGMGGNRQSEMTQGEEREIRGYITISIDTHNIGAWLTDKKRTEAINWGMQQWLRHRRAGTHINTHAAAIAGIKHVTRGILRFED